MTATIACRRFSAVDQRAEFRAMRAIARDEELTQSYGAVSTSHSKQQPTIKALL